jgi:hypothetical protein
MSETKLFVLLVLVTWRLSSLFAREQGPLHLFDAIRDGLKWLASKEWLAQKLFISLWEGIHCIACNSVWFSALAALVLTRGIINIEFIIYTLVKR